MTRLWFYGFVGHAWATRYDDLRFAVEMHGRRKWREDGKEASSHDHDDPPASTNIIDRIMAIQ